MNILMCFVFVCIAVVYTAPGCLLPLAEGPWYPTSGGTWIVTNNASKSYIQNFTAGNTPEQTYTLECVKNTDNKYIFKTTLHVFGPAFSAFTCIDITQIQSAPDVQVFYIVTPPESSTGERFSIFEQDACENSNYKTAENAHLLIQPGFEMESAISCSNDLIGIFDVTFRKTNGIIINEIEMDSCTDEKLMVFTNVTPNSTLGFTNGNIFHCLYGATSGTRVYLHTYNNDSSVDNVNTFRFACWVVEKIGNQTKATVFPSKCVSEQNATSVPSGGQTFVFTLKDTCDQKSLATHSTSVTSLVTSPRTTLVTPDTASSNTTREQTSRSYSHKTSRVLVSICMAYFVWIPFQYTYIC